MHICTAGIHISVWLVSNASCLLLQGRPTSEAHRGQETEEREDAWSQKRSSHDLTLASHFLFYALIPCTLSFFPCKDVFICWYISLLLQKRPWYHCKYLLLLKKKKLSIFVFKPVVTVTES